MRNRAEVVWRGVVPECGQDPFRLVLQPGRCAFDVEQFGYDAMNEPRWTSVTSSEVFVKVIGTMLHETIQNPAPAGSAGNTDGE